MATHLKIFFTSKRSLAAGAAFFLLGFLFGNFATLIPFIKSHYQIDDAELGMMLLCLPLGAMSFNPIAAILVQRFGMQKMTIVGMLMLSIAYALPLSAPSLFWMPIGLVLIGVSMTTTNIACNTLATRLETIDKINIMSTCHGMFSIGLMVGSLMRSLTLLIGVAERPHMYIMCTLGILLALIVFTTIMSIKTPIETSESADKFKLVLPSGGLLTIVIISVCVNMTEGSMTDWTSLYMKEVVQTSPYFVGWGLVGYSAFMAVGRLFGDGIIPIFGKNKILTYGAALAILGLLITIVLPYTWTAILGFSMVGLGVSCGSPILYASSARFPGIPNSGGLAIMNTFAMGGFLMGPVFIGFISNMSSLVISFAFVAFVCSIWFIKSQKAELY